MTRLDPHADFRDDGGAPGWRTRHQIIDIHRSRWAAVRAYAKRHPSVYLALAALVSLAAPAVFVAGLLGLLVWYRLFG